MEYVNAIRDAIIKICKYKSFAIYKSSKAIEIYVCKHITP
jgi:hypothetical protein